MKSLSEEKFISDDKTWPDLLKFVEGHIKSRYDIKLDVDTFTVTSMLRDRFYEYANQTALNSLILKSQKEKLTEKEALFLRSKLVEILKENTKLKYGHNFLLVSPV